MRRTLKIALFAMPAPTVRWACGCMGYSREEYAEHGCPEHGYWSPTATVVVPPGFPPIHDETYLEATQVCPELNSGVCIREDVVQSVRFALASLPEQSRMLTARVPRDYESRHNILSNPVIVEAMP